MHIAESREESREEDLLDDSKVCVYSDGSSLNVKAGAMAILFQGGQELGTAHYHLGLLSRHTTYEAETVGMLLALQLVREEDEADTVSIRLDNQAVVQALTSCRAKPVQSLLDTVHELCDDWKKRDRQRRTHIKISWVSGHDGVLATSGRIRSKEGGGGRLKPRCNTASRDTGGQASDQSDSSGGCLQKCPACAVEDIMGQIPMVMEDGKD